MNIKNKILPIKIFTLAIIVLLLGCYGAKKLEINDEIKIPRNITYDDLSKEAIKELQVRSLLAEYLPTPAEGMSSFLKYLYYPEEFKNKNIEGEVIVLAVIDENGDVIITKVTKSLASEFDKIAVAAIRKTKFIPGEINSEPITIEISIPIIFKE